MTPMKFSRLAKKLVAARIATGMTIAVMTTANSARGARTNHGIKSWKFRVMLWMSAIGLGCLIGQVEYLHGRCNVTEHRESEEHHNKLAKAVCRTKHSSQHTASRVFIVTL